MEKVRFEDVKVGDTVLIEKSVWYGYGYRRDFNIAVTVERITKTQFVTNGKRFKKDNGSEVCSGYGSKAYLVGEEVGYVNKTIAKDETKEMNEFILKLKRINEIKDFMKEIDNVKIMDLTDGQVSSLHSNIKGISNQFKEKENEI